MKALDYLLIVVILICLAVVGCTGEADAAESQGDGTIPLRIASLETDVAEIKSGLASLLAKFEEQGHTPTKSIMKAPRRPVAAPKRNVAHHTHKKHHPSPMTTCAPKCYIPVRVVCPPATTCGPRYYPMTTCSPKRVSCWGR